MQITIVSVEVQEKKFKYKASDGKTYNAWKDKIGLLPLNTTYEVEIEEKPWDNPVTKKTVMMKWINKAVTAGAGGATSAVGSTAQPTVAVSAPASAMSKDDWIEKENRARKTMVLSYAKDILVAHIGAGKMFTISDMIGWYEEMLKEVEK